MSIPLFTPVFTPGPRSRFRSVHEPATRAAARRPPGNRHLQALLILTQSSSPGGEGTSGSSWTEGGCRPPLIPIPQISCTTTKDEGKRPDATQNGNSKSATIFGFGRRSQGRPGPRSQGGDTGSNPVGPTWKSAGQEACRAGAGQPVRSRPAFVRSRPPYVTNRERELARAVESSPSRFTLSEHEAVRIRGRGEARSWSTRLRGSSQLRV